MSLQILMVMSCLFVTSLQAMSAEVYQRNDSKICGYFSRLPQDAEFLVKSLDRTTKKLLRDSEVLHGWYHIYCFGNKPHAICAHCNDHEMFLFLLQRTKHDCFLGMLELIAQSASVYVRNRLKAGTHCNIHALEEMAFEQAIVGIHVLGEVKNIRMRK